MATPQVKDLVLRSPAGSSEVITFSWPLQIGSGQDKHDNGIDIIDTIKFVCDELPGISSAFEEINLNQIDTACYKTMTNLVDRFNKAVDSIVALEKGTSLPAERLNKFAHPSLLRHILQLVYNAAVLDPDKLNNYEPFSPEVYGETSYELVQQMIKHVNVSNDDTFIDLGSGVGQVVLQMAGSFPLKTCIGIEKADTPARYAERMDTFFRQFMAWFGKRYCEYKLLKGDFLVDEHREKITTSSLVFVNNFAFGPNVDHQLKERFADLRDGARVVSSKSFCPLNFRITDRNLSDIGTIMHVSEIPPLKGSVSWTCKPVSYYLHVIDRTILERYFQRLKTQKGAENDHHVGSTRTTRDRAKREANNQALNHSNSNSNSATTNRTNSPANVHNHIAVAAVSKTRQQQQHQQQLQQQQQQQQQQRSMDMDSSTESDGDGASIEASIGVSVNAAATTNGTANAINGTAVIAVGNVAGKGKVWSDWCSSKGKSSQSDDEEENNNFSSTTNSRQARATTQKKRKKLTRKAAIASKSAAAAQREAAAREREAAAAAAAIAAATAATNKETSSKEDNAASNGPVGKGRKGRLKKGPGRGRKSLKIVGLDVLHKQTLLSTSVEVMSKKLPPAPGTVDQQLTALLTGDMSHTELNIPEAPQDTPYALQILLDVFRAQYMSMIDQMKSKAFIPNIKRQIQLEQERKQRIKNRASQLDKQIKVLIDDSVALLKIRMNELGINVSSPNDLIAKAKEIVGRHKELQGIAKKIQSQVNTCEVEKKRVLKAHLAHLPDYQKFCIGGGGGLGSGTNGKTKLELLPPLSVTTNPHDLSEVAAHELVLKEIANTLAQRKKLYAQVSSIEKEAAILEKASEERRTAAALLAQGTNMTLANVATTTTTLAPPTSGSGKQDMMPATIIAATTAQQPLQLTTTIYPNSVAASIVPTSVGSTSTLSVKSNGSGHAKSSRRSRDHRTRSQEWPDVPDVGKIDESNPEVLAQKILETGRQIEAGKFTATTVGGSNYANAKQQTSHPQHHYHNSIHHHPNNNMSSQHQHEEKRATGSNKPHQRSSSSEYANMPSIYMGPQDSTLMPAPAATKSQQAALLLNSSNISAAATAPASVGMSSQQPQQQPPSSNSMRGSSILPKCELPGSRNNKASSANGAANSSSSAIQESPKVANFEDRLKSIITSALNEDQEHRKAVAHQMPTSGGGGGMHNEPNGSAAAASSPQQSPAPKRSKQSAASANQHLPPPQQHQHQQAAPQNINNIINVATQGLTHLNATTTISPITPPLAVSNQYVGGNYVASKYGGATKESKYHHHAVPPPLPLPTQQQQQHYSNASEWKTSHQQDHRRRSSISAASYEQHFAALAQQQQQHHAMMMAAAAHSAHHQPQPNAAHHHGISSSASTAAVAAAHHNMLAMEFKAPTSAENLLAAAQRSNSRELLLDDASVQAPRSASANSDSALMYYPPTRDRLMSLERSISRESAVSQPLQMQQHQQHQSLQPSRPNSNSSQPDYTQVSPAKMALRRHLSQEKLNQQLPPAASGMLPLPSSSKTIGDLVNGEIERTLEISHQSIINAVVNMSTVGSATAGGTNATASVAASERQYLERSIYDRPPPSAASSSSTNERLLINPNAQRPERVHVRVLEEQSAAHNLATLVHVAYNNKTASGSEMGGGIASSITTKLSAGGATTAAATSSTSSSTTTANAAARYSNSRDAFNHLSVAAAAAVSGRTSSASVAAASSSLSYASARGGRADYQTVPLPRAEMKGCIEAYFSEEQHFQHQHAQPPPQQQQQQQQPQSHQHKSSSSSKDRSSARSSRMNGGNAPLEGLAASLQDRVMASRKYKEEHEERQRRAAVAAAAAANNSELHNHSHQQQQHQEQQQHAASQHFGNNHHGHHHQPHQHHQQHHPTQHYQAGSSNSTHNHNNGSPIKVEIGIKRTSPSAANQPRPSKIAHYAHEPQNHQLQQLQQHPQPSYQHHHMTSTSMMASSSSSSSSSGGHNNPYATTNGGGLHMHAAAHSSPTSTSSASRRHKLPLEPLLMSPEINSIMGDHERPTQLSSSSRQLQHHQQQQQQQTNNTTTSSSSSSTTPIAGGRAGDDDDVIADDESHWQHRVSSGFDRLVAFASTELDKTRRSIDTDTVPSSISCNTSPDSGITHSSSCNSDAARTFLSTSSTCSSQLELLPIGCSGGGGSGSTSSSTSSSGGGGYMQHQSQAHHNLLHHHASCSETLIDGGGSLKSLHSNKKTTCSVSPMDPSALESPPLSDIGMPRTPSPTNAAAAVPTPPLVAPAIAQPDTSTTTTLKIPLKYQRKSKSSSSSSEKHYKKKFCERNWEYDCDELMAYSNSSSTTAADAAGNAPPPATSTTTGSTNNASARQEHVPSSSSQKLSGKSPKEVTVADHHNYGSTSSNHQSSSSTAAGSAATSSSASAHYHHHHHHHKSSKFRPKGKDWDWSLDSSGSSTGVGGAKSKVADVVAVVSTAASSATTTTTNVN